MWRQYSQPHAASPPSLGVGPRKGENDLSATAFKLSLTVNDPLGLEATPPFTEN